MAYVPKINVFDNRAAVDNIIAFLKIKQSDALRWANNGQSVPIIKNFYTSPRTVTVFPSLTVLQKEHASEFKGDFLLVNFSVVLEVALKHGKQDYLDKSAPVYSMALESMLANIPQTTFGENSKINITVEISRLETQFALQGKFKSGFLQVFQTSAAWAIEAAAQDS